MIWSRICNRINQFAKTDTERDFETSLILLLLEDGLKWPSESIRRQDCFKIGATQSLRPDITIYKDQRPQFIIEVKKPSHVQNENDINQLISYMKQLEVNIGIYIGEKIEVFYKKIGLGTKAQLVLTTNFSDTGEAGEKFYELFNFEKFSPSEFDNYYKSWVKEKEESKVIEKEIGFLESIEGVNLLRNLLNDHLISKGIDDRISSKIISELEIQIKRKNHNSSISQGVNVKNQVVKTSVTNPITQSQKIHKKKSRFKFSMVGIKEGEELIFMPTGQKVKTVGDDMVEFNGEIKKLTPMARDLMPNKLRTPSDSYQGPKFFLYKGKRLTELRSKLKK